MFISIYDFPQSGEPDPSTEDEPTNQEPSPIMTMRYNFDNLDDYLATAEKVGSEGRLAEAIDILREAGERYPDSAIAQFNLGTALLLAVKEDKAHNELWESLSDEEDLLQQAIVAFQNAIDRDSHLLPAYNNLARALALHGRTDDAILVWERSLQLNPDQPDARADYDMLRTQLSASPEEMEARSVLLQDTGLDASPAPDQNADTHSDAQDTGGGQKDR